MATGIWCMPPARSTVCASTRMSLPDRTTRACIWAPARCAKRKDWPMVASLPNRQPCGDLARSCMLLTLLLVAFACAPLAAGQEAHITMTVQVLTVQGQPLPAVVVQVSDAAANQPLAEGTTDQRGRARFTTMPPTEIRVHLTGQLA